MGKKKTSLTDKQIMFVNYYVSSLDVQDAYIKAFGCSEATAKSNGYKLVNNPMIREAINEKMKKAIMSNPEILSADETMQRISGIAIDPDAKPSERLKALELMGKYHALFTEKVKTEGSMTIVVDIDIEDEESFEE